MVWLTGNLFLTQGHICILRNYPRIRINFEYIHHFPYLDMFFHCVHFRCVLEAQFKCRGFDYEVPRQICWLTELSPEQALGINVVDGWDYYEKSPGKYSVRL